MGTSKTYKIRTKLLGGLTQIPDSQKIFGSLIYMYASKKSDQFASELVKKVKTGKLHIALSNMLPEEFFPTPQDYILEQFDQKADSLDNESKKKIYQDIKKRSFLRIDQIKEGIKNLKNADEIYPYVTIEASQQIHTSMESQHLGLQGTENNIYSVPEIFVVEVSKKKDRIVKAEVSNFVFFLTIECGEECEKFEKFIEEAIEEKQHFFRGARASQGFNTFVLEEIVENSMDEKNSYLYLNLGMLLPKEIDFQKSVLKLFTSERRPYQAPTGWEEELKGRFISFIEAGSIICPSKELTNTGTSIQSPFSERDIIFGNAFLMPVIEEKEIQEVCNEKD